MRKTMNELIAEARKTNTAEELFALAKENSLEFSMEEAAHLFDVLHHEGELSDNELDNIAGGFGCSTADFEKAIASLQWDQGQF